MGQSVNFPRAVQNALQDGVLKRTELKHLEHLANKTADTSDDQAVSVLKNHFQDGQKFNLLDLKLGGHALTAVPLFGFEDDLQHPSIDDVKQGKIVIGADPKLTQTGPAVTKAQERLKAMGYPVEVTGKFDQQTQRFLKKFQMGTGCCGKGRDGLGQLGSVTWKRLNQMANTQAMRSKLVSVAQTNTAKHYDRSWIYQGTKESTQSLGSCYTYVPRAADAINRGSSMQGQDAFEAIEELKRDSRYQKIQVPHGHLKDLPEGAIVVWEQGTSKSGHISIADGKGNEISDFIQTQWEEHYGGGLPHVFLPIK